MDKKDLQFVSDLLQFALYFIVIAGESDPLSPTAKEDCRKLVERYFSYELEDESEVLFPYEAYLDQTVLDYIILDKVKIEDFFINTDKLSKLYLDAFENSFVINKSFFETMKNSLEVLSSDIDQRRKCGEILTDVEKYALSGDWKTKFNYHLYDKRDILKILSNPSLYIVKTVIKLWMAY
jgi:hypothetical protein